MLVIPREPGSKLGGPLAALDEALGGALTTSMQEHNFTAALGQRLLISIAQEGITLKFVVFVGLEETQGVQRYNLCGFYRAALDEAAKHGITRVSLPIFPHRLATAPVTLIGLTTILGCRVHNAPSAKGSCVTTVEVLCSPQAKRYAEKGTHSFRQLCYRCSDPSLPESSH
ncbi:MAG: M17 family peptidase N-terminal domain-containing protein [Terriglobales bacterium]